MSDESYFTGAQSSSRAKAKETGGALHWYELQRESATYDLCGCESESNHSTKAGARLARSMLLAMSRVERGSTGTLPYDGMAFEIQRYFAAAAFDTNDMDVMLGFTMALAIYLYPGVEGNAPNQALKDWDPVHDLVANELCNPDAPAIKKPAKKAGKTRNTEALHA